MRAIILLFFVIPLLGHAQVYHKLIEQNKFWDQACYTGGSVCNIDSGQAFRYYFQDDTLMSNGITYNKTFYFRMLPSMALYCPPFFVDQAPNAGYMLLREDTIQKKVYIYRGNGQEDLIYDFNLNSGDTLNSLYAGAGYLQTVDSTAIEPFPNGSLRKITYLTNGHYYIEGIGSPTAGLGQPMPPFWIGGVCYMLCVKQNGIDLTGPVCNSVPINVETMNSGEPDFYINSSTQTIHILKDGIYDLQLSDLTGKVIYRSKVSGKVSKFFNVSPGIYLFSLVTQNYRLVRKVLLTD